MATEKNKAGELQEHKGVGITASERFTNKVLAEFAGAAGSIDVTDYQRGLIQRYFIEIDTMLKTSEENRVSKNSKATDEKYKNDLPYTWENVNLNDLALDVVHYSKIGLDMSEANHLFAIPYKNTKTKKYDISFMEGYNGIKYKTEKYALDKPRAVTIEVVYSNDKFKLLKKSTQNRVEGYSFDIEDAFNRGTIIGGFGYIEYEQPEKNKVIVMTMADIMKRKPKSAAPEFWGGTKDVWSNGKKTGTEQVEGWLDEMVRKTLIRHVYSQIPLDPQKIDDSFRYAKLREAKAAEMMAKEEIAENANVIVIDADGEIIEPVPKLEPPVPMETAPKQVNTEIPNQEEADF